MSPMSVPSSGLLMLHLVLVPSIVKTILAPSASIWLTRCAMVSGQNACNLLESAHA